LQHIWSFDASHSRRHVHATIASRAESSNRFKTITEAYEILSDDTKRARLRYQQPSSSPHSSTSNSSSYSSHHYYDRDAAFRQRYSYNPYKPPKLSVWQSIQMMMGSKMGHRFEMTLAVLGTTFLFLGLGSVEHLWRLRNGDKLKKGWEDPITRGSQR
jgi:curved DNA-binding protein CbpA